MAGQVGASKTPTAAKSAETNMASTPKSQVDRVAVSTSLKRVHFSPRNEEFYNGMVPQSSPTRAQKRPRSRGILKRTLGDTASNSQQQQMLSSDIDGSDPYSDHGLLDQLSSYPDTIDVSGIPQVLSSKNNSAARVLFSSDAVSVIDNKKRQCGSISSGQIFKEAVSNLEEIPPHTDADMTGQISNVYHEIYDAIVKNNHETTTTTETAEEYGEYVVKLLDCLHRDINRSEKDSRQLVLAAIKCLGCASHLERVFGVSISGGRLSSLLKEMCTMALKEYPEDKAMCLAVVVCICIERVPVAFVQPAVPDMIGFCVHAMKAHDRSVTLVFHCLAAIEVLLKRVPATARSFAHIWLFPVLGYIVSSTPGVRSKADDIIRQNIPWVSADAHNQEMDASVSAFLEAQLEHFVDSCERLLSRGDGQVVARIWGILVTICARQCRARMSGMLHIMQKCFNSDDTDVLVAALMQWRCLIYAFLIQNQLERLKCVKLVMTPILALLASDKASSDVRLASVRCWATLVYALGENIGSHIDIVTSMAVATAEDTCIDVREIVARVLASLLNRIVLPEEKIARFVIPKMIIGTTTLAAADGKALSTTRGPFSSDRDYSGDHTATLCRYVIGVSKNSPVMPVLTDTIVKIIQQYIHIQYKEGVDGSDRPSFESFAQLCQVVLCVLDPQGAQALADALMSTIDLSKRAVYLEQRSLDAIIHSPLSILFEALANQLDSVLSDLPYNMDFLFWGFEQPNATYKQAVSAAYIVILLHKLLDPSRGISEDTRLRIQLHIKECTARILAPCMHSGSSVSEGGLCILFDILDCHSPHASPANAQTPSFGVVVDLMLGLISEHTSDCVSRGESIISSKIAFRRVLYAHNTLLCGSPKARLAFYAACREICPKDGFWSGAHSYVGEWVQKAAEVSWNMVDIVIALCDGHRVFGSTEELHCKALLYIVAGLALASIVGASDAHDCKQIASLTREATIEEVGRKGISVMQTFCSAKGDFRKLDTEHIAQLERVFGAIAKLLCFSCARTDVPPEQTCIPFSSEAESVDALISRSNRLCEETASANTKSEFTLVAEALTTLEQLKSGEFCGDNTVSHAIASEIDTPVDLEMSAASPRISKRPAGAALSSDDDEGMETASFASSSGRNTPAESETDASGKQKDTARTKRKKRKGKPRAEKTVLQPVLQQLHRVLEQLETELCDTTELGIDNLLLVQERICGIQQRLCKSMRKRRRSVGQLSADSPRTDS
ncbi:hypothetical protein IW140_003390 [Coemansia sp. RSA 1813]|nr:hypothetical protein EV178_003208 [Coemansia sp. RSA 1646]KAJ1771015.1 hypothetical protein LPJ74_002706 [Coemansia sp. RSA 1843]KAJ2089255.1 hypothetical protein IW138_003575 [Coemansia sp. RSA 986]KAJ2215084.1 hypothetical protein EV179_002452 [Coemansia sp. RSA 487]KAJ2569025.1 hypothetical protein IW140_003390 [Coemansia sp. RSA 1813]